MWSSSGDYKLLTQSCGKRTHGIIHVQRDGDFDMIIVYVASSLEEFYHKGLRVLKLRLEKEERQKGRENCWDYP